MKYNALFSCSLYKYNYTCIEIVKICETCEIIRFPVNYNFPPSAIHVLNLKLITIFKLFDRFSRISSSLFGSRKRSFVRNDNVQSHRIFQVNMEVESSSLKV